MAWVRVDANLSSARPMVRGGLWGGLVYRLLLEWAKARGYPGGVIPKDDLDSEVLLRAANLNETDRRNAELRYAEVIHAGFRAAVDAGLLEDLGTSWRLWGWDLAQKDPTNATRQAKHRGKARGAPPPDGVTVPGDVTPDGTGLDGTGRNGSPEAGAPRTDEHTAADSRRHELALSSTQRAELHARGLGLNRRTGNPAGWEKEVALRLSSGVPWEKVVALLEATKDQPTLPAFRVFESLDPPRPPRGRAPAAPGDDAAFRGHGRRASGG